MEGYFVGVGLRTPATRRDFAYKGAVGRAIGAGDTRYSLDGRHFVPQTSLALEGRVYRQLALQFGDYPHEVGPTNIDEFRYTLAAGFAGDDPRNYFERKGVRAGLRWRFGEGTFVRGSFMREDQRFLPIVTTNAFIGGSEEPNLDPAVGTTPVLATAPEPLEGFTPGRFAGFEPHFHHDNRQFRQVGLSRDYRIRQVGWYVDHLIHWSDPGLGSREGETFDFVKYRSTAGIRIPLLSSTFLMGEITFGGTSQPLPAQMRFSRNGLYVKDFERRRPFLNLGFNEGVGNRVTTTRIDLDLGSGFVRLFPIRALRQSGVQLLLWRAAGVRHGEPSLRPVMPWTEGSDDHVEVGAALTRLFGLFSTDAAVRVRGSEGNRVGFTVII